MRLPKYSGDTKEKVGTISFGRVVVPFIKIVITFPGLMRGYIVKENNIGTAVSEIFWYKKTNTKRSCYSITRIKHFANMTFCESDLIPLVCPSLLN